MVDLSKFNPICEEGRQKCACYQSAKAGKRIGKLVINPKSPRHAALCVASVSVCLAAWTAYAMPKVNPKLEQASAPLAAACMWMDKLMDDYESV
jgi:hypothetical protein